MPRVCPRVAALGHVRVRWPPCRCVGHDGDGGSGIRPKEQRLGRAPRSMKVPGDEALAPGAGPAAHRPRVHDARAQSAATGRTRTSPPSSGSRSTPSPTLPRTRTGSSARTAPRPPCLPIATRIRGAARASTSGRSLSASKPRERPREWTCALSQARPSSSRRSGCTRASTGSGPHERDDCCARVHQMYERCAAQARMRASPPRSRRRSRRVETGGKP